MYKNFTKRLLDFFAALILFIVLLPFFIFIAIVLTFVNKGTPFFVQPRPGKNERIFTIVKFKTMSDRKDAAGNLLSDNERLTDFGRFLRKTSLDEIPQLLNVIVGDMSFIGPRPLLPEYLPKYTELQRRRHEVKPGISGLAQVNGRNRLLFSERLNYDLYYVDHLTFSLDCKIALLTFKTIFFKRQDVVHGQDVKEVDDINLGKEINTGKKYHEY